MRKLISHVGLLKIAHRFGDGSDTLDATAIVTGILSTLHKMKPADIEEALKGKDTTAVLATLLDADKVRIKALTPKVDATAKFNEGYNKAIAEVAAHEAELRTEYGIADEELKGADLFKEIIKKSSTAIDPKVEEQVKLSPAYQQMEKRMKKELDDMKKAHAKELEDKEGTFKSEMTFVEVSKDAMAHFEGMKPILPEDAGVAANQKNWLINDLKGYQWSKVDGKIVATKDGVVVQNEHGHTMEFNDIVEESAKKYFQFAANDDNKSAGNKNPKTPGPQTPAAYPAGIKKPKTIAELTAIMNNSDVKVEDKRIVMNQYQEENKK